MEAYDFILDENGDLTFEDGDIVIGKSDAQHVWDIIRSYQGWWKNHPIVGCGIEDYINSSGKTLELERIIRIQLEADGYKVLDLQIDLTDLDKSIINVERIK